MEGSSTFGGIMRLEEEQQKNPKKKTRDIYSWCEAISYFMPRQPINK